MKIIIIILVILVLSSSINTDSELLYVIKKDIVDKALLYLPKKETRDILKMCFAMYSTKDNIN